MIACIDAARLVLKVAFIQKVLIKGFSSLTILLVLKNYRINWLFWSQICFIKSQKSLGIKQDSKELSPRPLANAPKIFNFKKTP